MKALIELLDAEEILRRMDRLDIDELIELAAITGGGKGDEDYVVRASKWFIENADRHRLQLKRIPPMRRRRI